MTELSPFLSHARANRSGDQVVTVTGRREGPSAKGFSAIFAALAAEPAAGTVRMAGLDAPAGDQMAGTDASEPEGHEPDSPESDSPESDDVDGALMAVGPAVSHDTPTPTGAVSAMSPIASHTVAGRLSQQSAAAASDGAQVLMNFRLGASVSGLHDTGSGAGGVGSKPTEMPLRDGVVAIASAGQPASADAGPGGERGGPDTSPAATRSATAAADLAQAALLLATGPATTEKVTFAPVITANATLPSDGVTDVGGHPVRSAGSPAPNNPLQAILDAPASSARSPEAGAMSAASATALATQVGAAQRDEASPMNAAQQGRADTGAGRQDLPGNATVAGAPPAPMLPPQAVASGVVQKPGDASGSPGQSDTLWADRANDRFSTLPVSSKPAPRTAGVTAETAGTAKIPGETSGMSFAADQTTAAGMTMTDTDAAGFSGRDVSDAAGASTGAQELRGGARLNAAAPDLPRQIAQHLADAPAAAAGQGIELQLSPEELGPIRLTLRHIDGQMMVVVAVERPETLDLMRRHADQLLQDMRALGYASVRLDMQAQGDRRPPRPPPAEGTSPVTAFATPSMPEIAPPRRMSGGLDLRF